MSRPIVARINLTALKHNFSVVRRYAPHSKCIVVVKSNGYGHGLVRVAKTLSVAEGFAVLNVEEAIMLRNAEIKNRIILLEGFFSESEIALAEQHKLSVVIHRMDQIDMIASTKPKTKLDLLLKINTGMNRLGFNAETLPRALSKLTHSAYVEKITMMTHFATADDAQGITNQLRLFKQLTENLPYDRCLANSAAIMRYPEAHADWVRPGIMIYGCTPFTDGSAQAFGLKPVMSLRSEIIAVQHLKQGDRVGYGGIYTAERAMRIGVVACGYADGYLRHAITSTPILVHGKHTRTVGRVSMDMMYADLSNIPEANVGSTVVLWGDELPVEDVAKAVGTVNYELLCALAARVPVVEING